MILLMDEINEHFTCQTSHSSTHANPKLHPYQTDSVWYG